MTANAMDNDSLYSQLDELVAFRFHVKQKKLKHQPNQLAHHSGEHTALKKGRGMTFSEVRQYQPGDDIRHIDWRVTARTQKPHTKLFIEENERPTLVVVEQTANMFFGSKVHTKAAQALNVAAILGWVSLQQNERIGALLFNGQKHHWQAAKRKTSEWGFCLQQAIAIQNQLRQPQPANPQDWPQALKQLLLSPSANHKVFLIGDMINMTQCAAKELLQLSKKADVSAIHIYDPLEKQLPHFGWLNLTPSLQSDNWLQLDSNNPKTQAAYQDLYQKQWQQTFERCSQLGIALIEVSSAANPMSALMQQQLIV